MTSDFHVMSSLQGRTYVNMKSRISNKIKILIQPLRAFRRARSRVVWSVVFGSWGMLVGALGGALGGLWGVLGGPWGGPGEALGGPWGSERILRNLAKSVLRAWGGLGGSMGDPGGSLGAPWGVLGGPWGVPGRSQATFWAPRSAPDDKGAHPGGSLGGSRRAEKSPETIFLRL